MTHWRNLRVDHTAHARIETGWSVAVFLTALACGCLLLAIIMR